jgi:hypothetical protein
MASGVIRLALMVKASTLKQAHALIKATAIHGSCYRLGAVNGPHTAHLLGPMLVTQDD